MAHAYIAVYSVIEAPEISPKFHSAEEFVATGEEQALLKAENTALALEVIANNRPGNNPTTAKAILLVSITDQNTKNKIYSVGYTVEE